MIVVSVITRFMTANKTNDTVIGRLNVGSKPVFTETTTMEAMDVYKNIMVKYFRGVITEYILILKIYYLRFIVWEIYILT